VRVAYAAVRPVSDNRAFAWALPAIVLLALTLRLAYLAQIRTIPFFEQPVGDAASYIAWAKAISAGDWIGEDVFYQAPAYPYLLAVLDRLVGITPWTLRLAQCALGSLACAIVAAAGWRLFGRRAGIVAGLLLAAYPPAIFFDGLVQKASLDLVLTALLLWLLVRALPREAEEAPRADAAIRPWPWAGIGIVLGLLCLTRENALLFVPAVLFRLSVKRGPTPATVRLARSAAMIAGVALILAPVALRNYAVGGELAITTVQAGPNFYIGNGRIATGRYVPVRRGHESPPFERADAEALAAEAVGHSLTPGEVSRYWWAESLDDIRASPTRWVRLLGTKWLLVWNAYEIPDTEGLSLYADWAPLLGVLGRFFHFGILLPLAVVGIVVTWPQRREIWLFYLLPLVLAAGVAIFYVVARYRYPLVPFLVLFAGAGVAKASAAIRGHDRRSVKVPLAAGLVAAIVANLPINPVARLNAMAYANLGAILGQQGKLEAAACFLQIAAEGAPDSAEVRFNLGLALAAQGRFAQAAEHYRAALTIDPRLIHANYNLGVALEALGRWSEAAEQYGLAMDLDPDDRDANAALQRLEARPPPSH